MLRLAECLAEDHAHARRLAEGLAQLPGLRVDLTKVQTNIVVVEVDHSRTAADLAGELTLYGASDVPPLGPPPSAW
ncbi:MAG: hypothetical protein ACOY35_08025 [Bacillota bacterium]|nr:hypothetical protein [Bacillota bacterium]